MTEPNQDAPKGAPEDTPESGVADDQWDTALSEQAAGQAAGQPAEPAPPASEDDDWASALAEQTAAANSPGGATPATAAQHVFQPLMDSPSQSNSDIDMIMDIPVQLSVELGRTRLTIKNILQLGQGSVVELDGLAGEPMDIFVNGYLIAQGEVVVVDEKYGIRLTDIITPSDRLSRLNSRR